MAAGGVKLITQLMGIKHERREPAIICKTRGAERWMACCSRAPGWHMYGDPPYSSPPENILKFHTLTCW